MKKPKFHNMFTRLTTWKASILALADTCLRIRSPWQPPLRLYVIASNFTAQALFFQEETACRQFLRRGALYPEAISSNPAPHPFGASFSTICHCKQPRSGDACPACPCAAGTGSGVVQGGNLLPLLPVILSEATAKRACGKNLLQARASP